VCVQKISSGELTETSWKKVRAGSGPKLLSLEPARGANNRAVALLELMENHL